VGLYVFRSNISIVTDNIHIRITRLEGIIAVHERGGTRCYDLTSWAEYSRMIVDFNTTGVHAIQNYAELPTRTPLHANTPAPPRGKPNLEDLA